MNVAGKKIAIIMLRVMVALIVLNFELLPLPGDLGDFTAMDVQSHRPVNTYVRLRAL